MSKLTKRITKYCKYKVLYFEEVKRADRLYKTQNNLCSYKIKKAVREMEGKDITEDSTTKQNYRAINDILKPENMAKML